MADGDFKVRIKGLKELDRALGKADKQLRTSLRSELRDAASDVATEAKDIAVSKGLVQTGDLVRGIRPYALTGRAGVRSTAKHNGFPYPNVLEFGGRGGGTYGRNASLYPAFDRKQADVLRKAEGLLDRVADTIEKG